ncbi:MAG: Maf family protein [Candidatus Eisenbacteria bacterium]
MAKRFPFSDREIILASSSPRRRYLLRLIRLKHTVAHPRVTEEDHADSDPVRNVLQLSKLKARSVKDDFSRGYILGADTIVVLDGGILGKPADVEEARSMLGRLCGRLHDVYTGLTLIDVESGKEIQGYERTHVKIRRMSVSEIDAYIETGEPMDKAGSYGIQGYGAAIVERVDGCYFNVVGLPVVRLLRLIRDMDSICGGK